MFGEMPCKFEKEIICQNHIYLTNYHLQNHRLDAGLRHSLGDPPAYPVFEIKHGHIQDDFLN